LNPPISNDGFEKKIQLRKHMQQCTHYVLRALKSLDVTTWVQTPFLKPKLHKESKNGIKPINYRPPPVMIFSKNCFSEKKIVEKIGHFVDF
jgi:hypothetical protein